MKGKIFNAQEVQSILNKSKVMFREVIKNKTSFGDFLQTREAGDKWYKDRTISMRGEGGLWGDYTLERFVEKFCPYQIGQKIFVKESWAVNEHYDNFDPKTCFAAMGGDVKYCVAYDSNNEFKVDDWAGKKRSTKSMPQWASRLTLLIKEIRAERLAEISEEDCWKEGLEEFADYQDQVKVCQMAKQLGECFEDPRPCFATHWNATHKKPEEKFEASPWVWCVTMEAVK